MKVGIIGAGNVGIGIADALTLLNIPQELIIYNRNLDRALGEVYDLQDAVPLLNGSTNIQATDDYKDLVGCKVIAVTVGTKQAKGQTRLDLLAANAKIIQEVMAKLDAVDLEANILIVTNPVDVLTRVALEATQRSRNKLFGSGTVLDTIRLKEELGVKLGVNRKNIHAFVVGEHGDSEFALWSVASVGPVRLKQLQEKGYEALCSQTMEKVKNRAYSIIEKKGYTRQGIGVAAAKIIKSILYDEKKIFTLSTKIDKECAKCVDAQAVISQPCVVGAGGVEKKLMFDCNLEEIGQLRASIKTLNDAYNTL